jgi:alkylation response protein AidB-like acyl-CoA dehydrogenase
MVMDVRRKAGQDGWLQTKQLNHNKTAESSMILTETQAEIREAARTFAQERLAPGAADRDRTHRFPREELTEMGALGFLGMLVPEAYGGSATDLVSYALAKGSSAVEPPSTVAMPAQTAGMWPSARWSAASSKRCGARSASVKSPTT